jgi:hypothetical protein
MSFARKRRSRDAWVRALFLAQSTQFLNGLIRRLRVPEYRIEKQETGERLHILLADLSVCHFLLLQALGFMFFQIGQHREEWYRMVERSRQEEYGRFVEND